MTRSWHDRDTIVTRCDTIDVTRWESMWHDETWSMWNDVTRYNVTRSWHDGSGTRSMWHYRWNTIDVTRSMWHDRRDTMWHNVTRCDTMWHDVTRCETICDTMWHDVKQYVTRCDTMHTHTHTHHTHTPNTHTPHTHTKHIHTQTHDDDDDDDDVMMNFVWIRWTGSKLLQKQVSPFPFSSSSPSSCSSSTCDKVVSRALRWELKKCAISVR